jgi:hypothetical protein
METVCVLAQNGGRFDTKRKTFWYKTENVACTMAEAAELTNWDGTKKKGLGG